MNAHKIKYKGFLFLFLLPLSLLLTLLASKAPAVIENVYSTGIYKVLSGILGRITSLFPFSLGEILVYGAVFFAILFFVKFIRKMVAEKENRKHILLRYTSTTLALISGLYFVFVIFCGLNYYRQSYGQVLGLTVEPSSKEALEQLSLYIIDETNIAKNDYDNMDSPETVQELGKTARKIYNRYGTHENKLDGFTPLPKAVTSSFLMSYTNITGVYFPFTFESNFNAHVPIHTIPATILHELAHFKGYMRENEANFIAYLVGINSDNPQFVYSARIMALSYLLNAYYKVSSNEEYAMLRSHISQEVIDDFVVTNTYWSKFQTPVATLSNSVNDSYLRANQQSGVKSYGEVVDLLLAYYNMSDQINS